MVAGPLHVPASEAGAGVKGDDRGVGSVDIHRDEGRAMVGREADVLGHQHPATPKSLVPGFGADRFSGRESPSGRAADGLLLRCISVAVVACLPPQT